LSCRQRRTGLVKLNALPKGDVRSWESVRPLEGERARRARGQDGAFGIGETEGGWGVALRGAPSRAVRLLPVPGGGRQSQETRAHRREAQARSYPSSLVRDGSPWRAPRQLGPSKIVADAFSQGRFEMPDAARLLLTIVEVTCRMVERVRQGPKDRSEAAPPVHRAGFEHEGF